MHTNKHTRTPHPLHTHRDCERKQTMSVQPTHQAYKSLIHDTDTDIQKDNAHAPTYNKTTYRDIINMYMFFVTSHFCTPWREGGWARTKHVCVAYPARRTRAHAHTVHASKP